MLHAQTVSPERSNTHSGSGQIRAWSSVSVALNAELVNTLEYVKQLASPDLKIRAVIGGFHLVNAGSERLALTLEALRRLEPDLVVPCHCTGESALTFLQKGLGEHVLPGAAGQAYWF